MGTGGVQGKITHLISSLVLYWGLYAMTKTQQSSNGF